MLKIFFGILVIALTLGISSSTYATEKELDCFVEVHKIDPVTGIPNGSVCDVKYSLADLGENNFELYLLFLPKDCTEKLGGALIFRQSNDPTQPKYLYMLYLNRTDAEGSSVLDVHGTYPGAIPNPFIGKYTYSRDPKSPKKDRQIELKCMR